MSTIINRCLPLLTGCLPLLTGVYHYQKIYRSYEICCLYGCFVSHSFIFFWLHFLSLYIYIYIVACFVCFCLIFHIRYYIVMFMYSYCYVCSVLGILFLCVVLCILCVYACTVLLPLAVNPIAVNKYVLYPKDWDSVSSWATTTFVHTLLTFERRNVTCFV